MIDLPTLLSTSPGYSRAASWGGILLCMMGLCLALSVQAQIEPRLVVGSTGGHAAQGGTLYSYHIGEVCVGTASGSFGMVTFGFLQPEVPIVLPQASNMLLSGYQLAEGGSFRLEWQLRSTQAAMYVSLWRKSPDRDWEQITHMPAGGSRGSWQERPSASGSSQWMYQALAHLPDGEIVRSNVVQLQLSSEAPQWQVAPNPAHEQVWIRGTGYTVGNHIRFSLTNIMGQTIWEHHTTTEANTFSIPIRLSAYSAGLYWLESNQGGKIQGEWVQVMH